MNILQFIKSKLRKKPQVVIPWCHPFALIATSGWIGRSKIAPGALCSLITTALAYPLTLSYGWPAIIAALIFCTIIGTLAANWVEKTSHSHDASLIVIDETVGILITILPLAFLSNFDPSSWLMAAVLFILFDTIKPWPIYTIDHKISGGFGVMLDDIVAGIFAAVCLYAILS